MSTAARREAWVRGGQAEQATADYLRDRGWSVVVQNWRGDAGEIDLIVRRDGQLRFVEVKARGESVEAAYESVDGRKQRRLVRAAEEWLLDQRLGDELGFMVAVVDTRGPEWQVEVLDHAFDA